MPQADRLEPPELDLEPPLPRPLKAIALLPAAATLGNLLCGVMAIFGCLLELRGVYFDVPRKITNPMLAELFPTYITGGVYLIVLAMICDALDGRLARLARRTSEFGAQLDSLADTVSFGVAPAMLYITLLLGLAVPPGGGAPLVGKLEWRLGLFSALFFISCAAIRLARYNAENTASESAQKKFTGMPTPGAAAGFCGALLLHDEFIRLDVTLGGFPLAIAARWLLIPFAVGLGLFMVSRLEHIHIFNVLVRREQPLPRLLWVVAAIGFAIYWLQALLISLAAAYVLSGVAMNLYQRMRPAARRDGAGFHPN